MNKRTLLLGLAVLLVALLLVGAAMAQISAGFDLSWYVLAGGGEEAAGTDYALVGTLGQWVVGPSAGVDYDVNSGYWSAVSSLSGYTVYLPLLLCN